MKYLSVKETAEKWHVSERYVQKRCAEGRMEGIIKFSGTWMIPDNAVRPIDKRRKRTVSATTTAEQRNQIFANSHAIQKTADSASSITAVSKVPHIPMPLMNTAFPLGSMRKAVDSIADEDDHNIALAEYYFYTGQAKRAVEIVQNYLDCDNLALKLSACFLYGFASLAIDKIQNTRQAMAIADGILKAIDENTSDHDKALAVFVCSSQYTLLHLKRPDHLPELQQYIHLLPFGLRLFALYVQARFAYMNRLYGVSIGIAETALALENKLYPVPSICLKLQCTMGYMLIPYPHMAKKKLYEAWDIAKKDDIIEAFGELHGELSGMLEAVIKKENSEDFRKMIKTAKEFSAGWREIHNALTGNQIPSDLTPTEFTVAMLVARRWLNKEIAVHLDISENTVKKCVTTAMQKMHISKRADFEKIMLPK